MPFSMTRLKKIKIKTLVAWSILKDVQDQKHIINFVWPKLTRRPTDYLCMSTCGLIIVGALILDPTSQVSMVGVSTLGI